VLLLLLLLLLLLVVVVVMVFSKCITSLLELLTINVLTVCML
jgi:hypothetical protein